MQLLIIIQLLYSGLYFILAGQAVFYKLCFAKVFNEIPATEFISIRRLADPILQSRLSIIYYSSLGLGITYLVLMAVYGTPANLVLATLALLLLCADIMLAKRHNIPLNLKIRQIDDTTGALARQLQHEWIKWIEIRGHFILAGFFVLLFLAVTR